MVYLPALSVVVPENVSLMITVTPMSGCLFLSVTIPDTVILPFGVGTARIGPMPTVRQTAAHKRRSRCEYRIFFIDGSFKVFFSIRYRYIGP